MFIIELELVISSRQVWLVQTGENPARVGHKYISIYIYLCPIVSGGELVVPHDPILVVTVWDYALHN